MIQKKTFIFALLLLLCAISGCRTSAPIQEEPHWAVSARTRELAEQGQFHLAMRLLPRAMRLWDEYINRTGQTHEGVKSFVYSHVMGLLVHYGDAQWGMILDDPEIPYSYKTAMIFEILEIRLGKGSAWSPHTDLLIVPRAKPLSSWTEVNQLMRKSLDEPNESDNGDSAGNSSP